MNNLPEKQKRSLFGFLTKHARVIMVIGLVTICAVAIPNLNNPAFEFFKSPPLYAGIVLYAVGRILLFLEGNRKQ